MKAEVIPLRPAPAGPQTRRRRSFQRWTGYERRKNGTTGFDIAHALEINLDRHPTREDQWLLLAKWLEAAKSERLAERYADYVRAVERAMVVMARAPTAEHAIMELRS
jgi:hypothetical protein